MTKKDLMSLFSLVVGFKIIIFTVIFLSYNIFPFSKNSYYLNFVYPKNESISLVTSFKTWDAQHYLFLAENGYTKGNISNAFFPLYPIFIGILDKLINNSFFWGIIISNISSFFLVYYLFLLVKDNFGGRQTAFTAILVFLTFPTAFYTSLIYTESIFILLIVLSFYHFLKKNYLMASIFSFFIPIARAVGVYIVPIIFLEYLRNRDNSSIVKFRLSTFNKPIFLKINLKMVVVVFPVIGLLTYLLFMYKFTGDAFEAFNVINYFVGKNVGIIFTPWVVFSDIFRPGLVLHGITNSLIDRIFFILFLISLPFIYKKFGFMLFFYSLFLGFVPIFGGFMSYSRYLLPIFPIFILLAGFFEQKKYSFLKIPYLFFSFSIQVIFIVMHALNYWVS